MIEATNEAADAAAALAEVFVRMLFIPLYALVCHVTHKEDHAYIVRFSLVSAILEMWRPSQRRLKRVLECFITEYGVRVFSLYLHTLLPDMALPWHYGIVYAIFHP